MQANSPPGNTNRSGSVASVQIVSIPDALNLASPQDDAKYAFLEAPIGNSYETAQRAQPHRPAGLPSRRPRRYSPRESPRPRPAPAGCAAAMRSRRSAAEVAWSIQSRSRWCGTGSAPSSRRWARRCCALRIRRSSIRAATSMHGRGYQRHEQSRPEAGREDWTPMTDRFGTGSAESGTRDRPMPVNRGGLASRCSVPGHFPRVERSLGFPVPN